MQASPPSPYLPAKVARPLLTGNPKPKLLLVFLTKQQLIDFCVSL